MNTLIRPALKTSLHFLLFLFFVFSANTSGAVVTNTLLSQDFSGNSENGFPPQNWSTDNLGIWYGSNSGIDKGTGDGGFNGSAMFDMFDYCATENLYSPQFDASAYGGTGATITLDFDYWWESTFFDQFGNNTVTIFANDGSGNQIQLGQLFNNSDFTFSSGNFSENYSDPLSDPTLWKHKTFTIPAAYATSLLQIIINGDATGVCGGGGNFGVDNIIVTGSLPQNITYAPAALTFGSVGTGTQSPQQCVTLSNPSSTDITINSVQIQGAQSSQFFIVGETPSSIPAGGSTDICVVFAPVGTGMQLADLVIGDNSDNNPSIDIPLTGTAIAPQIEIDPIGSVNTSTQMFKKTFTRLGSSLQQSLLVKNSGQGSLVIDEENTFIGGDFPGEYSISRLPANPILANQTDTLSIVYQPTMEGLHSAKLFIASNGTNGTQEVDLFGIGILPKIVVTPSIINFDSVGVGDTSCMNVTYYNPGSDTLTIKQNYLSSNDGDFIYVPLSSEKLNIPPGMSQDVSLCFVPLQRGVRQARLTVVTNIPETFDVPSQDTGIINVDISGTGVPFGKLSISMGGAAALDSALIGTQVCHQATIANVGQADVTLTSATIGGNQASDFTLSGITLPLVVQAQTSINVTICATPSARGLRQGTLLISGMSGDKVSGAAIPLAVFGEIACAAPVPLALFQSVKVLKDNSDTEAVVVTNCGDLPATYTATVTGDGYSILSPAGGTIGPIAANGSATYQIIFNPTTTGVKNGTLLISSSNVTDMNIPLSGEGACATVTAQSENVPATGVGASITFHVTITNTGNSDWTPGTGLMTPSDVYSVTSITPSTIPAGMTGDVLVQFSPKVLGTATAELTFPNAGPCQESAVVVDFSGEGVVNAVSEVANNGFSLDQNYPNPFVSSTTFNYTLPAESTIRITLCDMTGKQVKELVSGRVSEGNHSVTFDASQLSSGTYVYTLEAGAIRLSKDLVLSK